ncbi:MAG: hypothetical protein ACKOOI_10515, partial [Pirellula sp.]
IKQDGQRWSRRSLSTKPQPVRTLEFVAGIGGLKAAYPWLDVQARSVGRPAGSGSICWLGKKLFMSKSKSESSETGWRNP